MYSLSCLGDLAVQTHAYDCLDLEQKQLQRLPDSATPVSPVYMGGTLIHMEIVDLIYWYLILSLVRTLYYHRWCYSVTIIISPTHTHTTNTHGNYLF